MILEKDNTELILNELNEIADFDENESSSPIIKERRSFAKTMTFRKLRQGHLTEEELRFMLEHFTFQGLEVGNLIADNVKDLTIDKFLKIGGVEYVYARGEEQRRGNRELVYSLLNKIKLKNKTEDLSKLLTYVQGKERFKESYNETLEIVSLFIERLYISGYDIRSARYKKKLEEIEAIKNNYAVLYDIINNKSNYKSNTPFTRYDLNMPIRRNIEFENIMDTFGDKIGSEITSLLRGMRKMPFSDFSFGVKFITENIGMPDLAKLTTLYAILVSENLDPLLDMHSALVYAEHYHARIETQTSLDQILGVAINGRFDFLDNFAERILNDNFVSLDRSREIYKNYFEAIAVTRRHDASLFRLKVMIDLRLTDNEIAEAVQAMIDNGDGMYVITESFKCDPRFSWSYPGERTLKKILFNSLKKAERSYHSFNMEDVTEDTVTEKFYNDYLNSYNGRVIMTWKMASNPKFIQQTLAKLSEFSYTQRMFIDQINFKAIGFKRFMQILENVQREGRGSFHSDCSVSHYGFKTIHFTAVPASILETATQEELVMYKHKIKESVLLQSPHTPFEVVKFYLDIIDKKFLPDHRADDLKNFIVQGLSVNTTLTTEEQVETMAKIGTKRYVNRFQRMKAVESKVNTYKIDISIPNKEMITVEDFHNYYSKVREK